MSGSLSEARTPARREGPIKARKRGKKAMSPSKRRVRISQTSQPRMEEASYTSRRSQPQSSA